MCRPLALLLLLLSLALAPAHDGLDIDPPKSEPEAWNAIQLCLVNLDQLIEQQQWSEVPLQVGIVSQAAWFLRERSKAPDLASQWSDVEATGIAMVRASIQKQGDKVASNYKVMRGAIAALEQKTDPKIAKAPVWSCPMCRGVRELDPKVDCFKCGMRLVPRVIPASSLYNTPGEPSVALTPQLSAPLAPGRVSKIRIKFTRKKDGAPITPDDLLVVHTERIHLLVVDQSLGDYHHEHPKPTEEPGVYEFSFKPERIGPYRVFADIVPAGSNVQEYAICDLPGSKPNGDDLFKVGLPNRSQADNLQFEIDWNTGGLGIPAKQPVNGLLSIKGADGQPFTQLEPVMGTYAHLVAFNEDRQTVLHIHPTGGADPQKPEDRGGPRFNFRFWAPKPGFYRLYVQIQVGGKQVFAPFVLNVE